MRKLILAFFLFNLSAFAQIALQGNTKIQGNVTIMGQPTVVVTLVSIALSPANPRIAVSQTQSFTANGTYSDGSTADVTASCIWSSDNLSVATMSGPTATGQGAGTANISCTVSGIVGSTQITVSTVVDTTTSPLPQATLNQAYGPLQFTASGGVTPYAWSCTAGCTGSNPAAITGSGGLVLSTAGIFSGTCTNAGTYNFTVRVTDNVGNTDTDNFSIKCATASTTVAALPNLYVNNHDADSCYTTAAGANMIVKTLKNAGGDYTASSGPNTPVVPPFSGTGLNRFFLDAEFDRVANPSHMWRLVVDAGVSISVGGTASIITMPQSPGDSSTSFICITVNTPLRSGVQVGTVAISSISRNSAGVVTVVTLDPHGLSTGDIALVRNVLPVGTANFNGKWQVTVLSSTTFTYDQSVVGLTGMAETFPVPSSPPFSVVVGPNTLAQQLAANFFTVTQAATAVVHTVWGCGPSSGNCADVNNGPHHFAWRGAEITTGGTIPAPLFTLGAEAPFSNVQFGFHLGVDQMYVHGCEGSAAGIPTFYPMFPLKTNCGSAEEGLKTGFRLNCVYCWVTNSMLDQMIQTGVDTHAFGTYDGQGPFKVTNNHLRDAATTWHWGGTPVTFSGISPSDVEGRLNWIEKDPNVIFISNAGGCKTGGGGPAKYGFKNNYEVKNGQRHLIDGNFFDTSWCDGQAGAQVLLNPRACPTAAGCGNDLPTWVNDISITNNLFANSSQWDQSANRGGPGGGLNATGPMHNIDILNNMIWNVGYPPYNGSGNKVQIWAQGMFVNQFNCTAARDTNGIVTLSPCTSSQTPPDQFIGLGTGDLADVSGCTDATMNGADLPITSAQIYQLGPLSYQTNNTGNPTSGVTGCVLRNEQGYVNFFNARHNTAVTWPKGQGMSIALVGGQMNVHPRNMTYVDNLVSMQPTGSLHGGGSSTWTCSNATLDGSSSAQCGSAWQTATFLHHHNVWGTGINSTFYSDWNPIGVEVTSGLTTKFPANNACNGSFSQSCIGFRSDGSYPAPDWAVSVSQYSSSTVNAALTLAAQSPYFVGQQIRYMPQGNGCVTSTFVGTILSVSPAGCSATGNCTQITLGSTPSGSCATTGTLGIVVADSRSASNPKGGDWHDFCLNPSSAWHNYASDGTDVGPNCLQIEQHQVLSKYNSSSFAQ